jgi:hypothetical protein
MRFKLAFSDTEVICTPKTYADSPRFTTTYSGGGLQGIIE